jgi:hypothetical protein
MEMKRRRNSGQILLIAALIMASLLLSAQLYILDVGKITGEVESDSLTDFVLALKLGSRHVVIGSLANISNGGQSSILGSNLLKWSSLISEQYPFGRSTLNYALRETAPYSSGAWIDWTTNGIGVSSACVDFTYKLSDREISVNQTYVMNITTTVLIESTYRIVSGDTKQVNVTINLLNEAQPALAEQVTIYYKVSNSWLIPNATNSYEIIDYGNGRYTASFNADIPSQGVEVSAHVVDKRKIYVLANATSTQI